MARKKTIKDTATSAAPETEEILDGATPARAHNEDGTFKADDPSTPDVNEAYAATEEGAGEDAPEGDAPTEGAGDAPDETPGDAPDATPEVAPPVVSEKETKAGAVFAIKDGAVEFVLRRLRSRLSRADLPDAEQVSVILAAIAAGKTAVVYRSSIAVGALSPGRPTYDLVNDLQRHGYLNAV